MAANDPAKAPPLYEGVPDKSTAPGRALLAQQPELRMALNGKQRPILEAGQTQ